MFVPSTPTAFSGYVVVVPRHMLVELPLKVEDAMRLLVMAGCLGRVNRPNRVFLARPLHRRSKVPNDTATCDDVSDGPGCSWVRPQAKCRVMEAREVCAIGGTIADPL